MRRLARYAGLSVALAAVAVSSASADPAMFKSAAPIGTGSNTSAISGNAAGFGAHTFSASGAQVTCADAVFGIVSVATLTTTIRPIHLSCRYLVAGTPVGAATVHPSCHWDLSFHHANIDLLGHVTDPTMQITCAAQVTVPSVGCTIDIPAQTRSGLSMQNIDAAGANTSSLTPWGSKIVASIPGLTYTTTTTAGGNCAIPEHGTGTYAGTVAVKNLWGSP
jgi:hypothetical protein